MIKKIIKVLIGKSSYVFLKIFKINKNLDIFLFHEVSDEPSNFQKKYNIFHNKKEFEKIINWINENYNIISPLQIDLAKKKQAIISFDDGYHGSFCNALPVLLDKNLPSIHFLNMKPIITNKPNIVSTLDFLNSHSVEFRSFLKDNKIYKNPIYEFNPELFEKFSKMHSINYEKINLYQGKIVNLGILHEYSNSDLVFLGNHLFDHWNVIRLSNDQLKIQYFKNMDYLKEYKNFTNIFSFTHGVPNKNFSKKNVEQIMSFKPKYIYYSAGSSNNYNDIIFDRTFTTFEEINNKIFYFRKFRNKFLSRF